VDPIALRSDLSAVHWLMAMTRPKQGRAFVWGPALLCWATAVTCLSAVAVGAKPDTPVQVVVGEQPLELKPPAVLRDGKVMAPLRQCLSAVGARVVKKAKGQLAITAPDGSVGQLHVGQRKLIVGDTKYDLPARVSLHKGLHVGPVADVLRALGLAVAWDASDRVLRVQSCVTDVRVRGDENGVTVEIEASAPTAFAVNTLPDPPRRCELFRPLPMKAAAPTSWLCSRRQLDTSTTCSGSHPASWWTCWTPCPASSSRHSPVTSGSCGACACSHR